jgi:large subunit ribosomal protein L15
MKYNELTSNHRKSPKRVGRGIAAGQGKTAGRGTKGQGARTGSARSPGFEGGQNPLMQRLPKLHGFKSHLVSSPYARVKLLNRGELTGKVTVNLQAASETAVAAIENAGGTFTKTARLMRPATKKADEK